MLLRTSGLAQDYPAKPVRIIAGGAGSTHDIVVRHLAQGLAERWGSQVFVENRSGSINAAGFAAKAAPDGYTLHIGKVSSFAGAVSLNRKLPYDPARDFAPITRFADVPMILIAHPSLPAKSLREFIDYAKKRSGVINYSSLGDGTGTHLTIEMLAHAAGVKLAHVPYKGAGEATKALVRGEVAVQASIVPDSLPQVKTGKVRAYAITSRQRFAGASDIPTVDELGLRGFESTVWFGMFAPARTPSTLIERLNQDMVAILRTPATGAWLMSQGAIPSPSTPEELAAFVRSETNKWRKVVELAGVRPD